MIHIYNIGILGCRVKNRAHLMRKVACALSFALVAILFMSSCSTTSNIPEDEQLYTGIKSIDYKGVKRSSKAENDSAGIIKSIADAARTVDNLLNSKNAGVKDLLELAGKSDTLSEKERRIADKQKRTADAKAWENASEEVDGVLAYPPNASLFGSSDKKLTAYLLIRPTHPYLAVRIRS